MLSIWSNDAMCVTETHLPPGGITFRWPSSCPNVASACRAADLKMGVPRDSRKHEGYLILIRFLSRLKILIPTPQTLTEEHLQWLLKVHLFSKNVVSDQDCHRSGNLAVRLTKISALSGGFEHSRHLAGIRKRLALLSELFGQHCIICENTLRCTYSLIQKGGQKHSQPSSSPIMTRPTPAPIRGRPSWLLMVENLGIPFNRTCNNFCRSPTQLPR